MSGSRAVLRPRSEAPLGAVRETTTRVPSSIPSSTRWSRKKGTRPRAGTRAGGGHAEAALERAHGRSDPRPASNGGLRWKGTPRTNSFSACQWMSASTCRGMSG